MYAVVLAGGGGTRLHPLSSPGRPKPFLPLLGEQTLLQRTVARLAPLVAPRDVTVVTCVRYADLVREQVPECAVLPEPLARNTAAAVALAAMRIARPMDEVMLVVPADTLIEREDEFRDLLASAERVARGEAGGVDPLVTLGIVPTGPSIEYGYLVPGDEPPVRIGSAAVRHLSAFQEKPDAARAKALLRQPGVAWNGGMFLWTRMAIFAALARYTGLPGMLADVPEGDCLAAVYRDLPSISVDYAVLEPAARDGRVLTMGLDAGWSDLGGWPSLMSALGAPPVGRVVGAGESVVAASGDLLLRRLDGHMELCAGDGTATSCPSPMAYFPGGSQFRDLLGSLVARVEAAADGRTRPIGRYAP